MKEKLYEIIINTFRIEEFSEESKLYDIGFDSIRILELIVVIEEVFGISINDEDLVEENFETLLTISSMIDRYCK